MSELASADARSHTGSETERVRHLYEKVAGRFDRKMGFWEKVLIGKDGRGWACSQAQGDVLEIAIGTGRNLPYYPQDVRLTGIDLSPAMLDIARLRAAELNREVDLRVDDAQALEFPDESFDTIVCTFSLCTIPDDRKAVAEAGRVLRPGGKLLLTEHVRSPLRPVRIGERALEPLTLRFERDHLTRDPVDYLTDEGFETEVLERSRWGIVERVVARKRAR